MNPCVIFIRNPENILDQIILAFELALNVVTFYKNELFERYSAKFNKKRKNIKSGVNRVSHGLLWSYAHTFHVCRVLFTSLNSFSP